MRHSGLAGYNDGILAVRARMRPLIFGTDCKPLSSVVNQDYWRRLAPCVFGVLFRGVRRVRSAKDWFMVYRRRNRSVGVSNGVSPAVLDCAGKFTP